MKRISKSGAAFAPAVWMLLGFTTILFGVATLLIEKLRLETQLQGAVVREAASFAAKSLPFIADAEEAARQHLALQAGIRGNDVKTDYDSNKGVFTVSVSKPLVFPNLLGGVNELAVATQAQARLRPRRVVLFLDNSPYMGPPLSGDGFYGDLQSNGALSRWRLVPGDVDAPGSAWRPSSFLAQRSSEVCTGLECGSSRHRHSIVTQQCYNPVFSSVKEGVIIMHDYFTASGGNQVAVLTGPDIDGGLFAPQSGFIDTRIHPRSGMSDLDCYEAAVAAGASAGFSAWAAGHLPPQRYDVPYSTDPQLFPPDGVGQYAFPSQAWSVDGSLLLGKVDKPVSFQDGAVTATSMRAAIWSKLRSTDRPVALPLVLGAASNIFRGYLPSPSTDLSLLFVALGDFPHGSGGRSLFQDPTTSQFNRAVVQELDAAFASLFAEAGTNPLWVVLAIVRHDGMEGNCADVPDIGSYTGCTLHYERVNRFNDGYVGNLFSRLYGASSSPHNHQVLSLSVGDSDSFAQEVAGYLPLLGRQVQVLD